MRKALLQTILALVIAWSWAPAAEAATLVMVDWSKCPYCKRFNREVAPSYASVPAGQRAPIRRVRVANRRVIWPADLEGIRRPRGTPTFILLDNGREIGRFAGYRGRDWFWSNLNTLLAKAR